MVSRCASGAVVCRRGIYRSKIEGTVPRVHLGLYSALQPGERLRNRGAATGSELGPQSVELVGVPPALETEAPDEFKV